MGSLPLASRAARHCQLSHPPPPHGPTGEKLVFSALLLSSQGLITRPEKKILEIEGERCYFFVSFSLSLCRGVRARFPLCHISHWAQNLRARKISRYFDKLERSSFFSASCSSVAPFSLENKGSGDRCKAEGGGRDRRMCDADDIRREDCCPFVAPAAPPPQSFPPKGAQMRKDDGIKFCGFVLCFGGSELISRQRGRWRKGGVISFLRGQNNFLPLSYLLSLSR